MVVDDSLSLHDAFYTARRWKTWDSKMAASFNEKLGCRWQTARSMCAVHVCLGQTV